MTEKIKYNFYISYWDSYKELTSDKEKIEFIEIINKIHFFEINIHDVKPKSNNVKLLFTSLKHSLWASLKGYCDKKGLIYENIIKSSTSTPYQGGCIGGFIGGYQDPCQQLEINNKKLEINNKKFIPPIFEEVESYALEKNRLDIARKFFEYYDVGDWKDAKGNKIKNWKQKFITWCNKNEEVKTETPIWKNY